MPDWKKRFASSYRYMRVDRKTNLDVERLRNICNGGTIERNLDTNYETGKVSYKGALDLGSDLLRVYLEAAFPDGSIHLEPLGTFLVSTPKRPIGQALAEADLSGRLAEVDEDEFDQPRLVPAGTNAVDYAAKLLREAGLEVNADQSDFKLTTAWVVGAIGNGESNYRTRLKAVNALLAAAGFSSASCDPLGRVLLRKYIEPDKRAPTMVMEEGKGARFVDDGTEEFDKSKVANVVHIDYSTSDESIRGTAIDSDPNSEYSTVRRGWRKAVSYTRSELPHGSTAAERQANANAEAQSLLATEQSAIHRLTATHIYAPVGISDAIDVRWPSEGISGNFAIRKQTLTLVGGCPMELEMRRFER